MMEITYRVDVIIIEIPHRVAVTHVTVELFTRLVGYELGVVDHRNAGIVIPKKKSYSGSQKR